MRKAEEALSNFPNQDTNIKGSCIDNFEQKSKFKTTGEVSYMRYSVEKRSPAKIPGFTRCSLAEEDPLDDTLTATFDLDDNESETTLCQLRESLTFSLHGADLTTVKTYRNPIIRQSQSVPRELDPSNLSYEAKLGRNPLNLCIESLDCDNLSFPGGLYNIPQQRSSLSSQSMDHLDSVSSSNTSSPCKTPQHEIHYTPSKLYRSSPTHHPHHQNHLPQHHLHRRHRPDMHARSEPPPLLV